MTSFQILTIFFLRITLGCMMFYAGITKVTDPTWSPFGYLARAKTFPDAYALLLDPHILPYVTFLNAWGLTLIGIALLAGIGVRIASVLGAIMMLLYYFPVLAFPHVGENAFIVDQHVIYAAGFLTLCAFARYQRWTAVRLCTRLPFGARISGIIRLLG